MVKDNEQSARESSIASGWTVEGQAEAAKASAVPVEDSVGDAVDAANGEAVAGEGRAQLSNVALVLLGLLGGLYLLFMYVWFSWAGAVAATNAAVVDTSGSLGGALQQVIYYLAPFAPAFWFITVLVLCRGAKVSRMLIWLLIGLVLLVPLPMFGGMF
ncbi:hypothetical protein QBL02_05340 [Leucobacter sp. UT-8R-CII-1-4]|uniref:hypothetical protein n=1 Tax=Leucobacter sp. UT-8R-CII-1-4 TaxID=3040075 RepID=UPI0024A835BD|nr:hypothetical protein [Leucobacter sp. UT-8R-CII-1-4]MDI6022965.1 hypothetical protein [Leucobacter sp. UT-8R-CII-1-4]